MVKRLCSLPVDSSGFRAHSSAVDPGHHCGPGGRALATSVTMSQIAEEAAIRDAVSMTPTIVGIRSTEEGVEHVETDLPELHRIPAEIATMVINERKGTGNC